MSVSGLLLNLCMILPAWFHRETDIKDADYEEIVICDDHEDDISDSDSESVFEVFSLNPNENLDLSYGTPTNFSQNNEIYNLDQLLSVFARCCQKQGCANVPDIDYPFVGTTLVINCSCPPGRAFGFCSSHEVNLMYVYNVQVSAAVLLSRNRYGKISWLA